MCRRTALRPCACGWSCSRIPKRASHASRRIRKIPVESEALLAGFTRLARSNPAAADALLPALVQRGDLGTALPGRLRKAAALGDAFGRQSGAVAAFDALPAEEVDGSVQEWRVRAALWAGNFEKAQAWIEEMPGTLASQPRWRYWRAGRWPR